MSNSGHRNSGNRNSGNRNSGNENSGNRNSGHCNSGHCNSGNRNSGNWNSCKGDLNFLCTESSGTIRVFNKSCTKEEWDAAKIPDFFYFQLVEWVEDSAKTEGGYLKTYTYKEAWQRSWETATEKDRRSVENLPNFDWKIFTELTGIQKPQTQEQKLEKFVKSCKEAGIEIPDEFNEFLSKGEQVK